MLLDGTTTHQSTLRLPAGALFAALMCGMAADGVSAHAAKTVELAFATHDDYDLFGKLTTPDSGGPFPVVIYVQTAEGMTVDMKRPLGGGKTFNYFDLYADKLPEMGVAFFRYEGRGIRMGHEPPRFEAIDWDVYNTSTLENKVRDILSAVAIVQEQPDIDKSQIWLMGASEGTLLAAQAAARARSDIAGLVLYGVMAKPMPETFKYIVTDGAHISHCGYFDTNHDGKISKAEWDADPGKYRTTLFKGLEFALFDKDGDGTWTLADTRKRSQPMIDAIDHRDFAILDAWAKTSAAVATPTDWFKDHFAQKPLWTFLSQLDIPVGMFQGMLDTSVPYSGVQNIDRLAKETNKIKMEFHYFARLDHTLGIGAYFVNGTLPDGHKAIFDFLKRHMPKR